MVATILIACGAWLLVRQDGINGDHVATFGWRWRASPEERLLAQENEDRANSPAPSAATTPVAPTVAPSPSASASPTPAAASSTNPTIIWKGA